MRHVWIAVSGWLVFAWPSVSQGQRQEFSLSTGYNESALTSGLNRGTAVTSDLILGRQRFVSSLDSDGLTSLGIGWVVLGNDFERSIFHCPLVTAFGKPGTRPGVEFKLHNEWYLLGRPTNQPAKWMSTIFETEAGIVCQGGLAPKVRVSQRFTTLSRRFPGRSQGAEWVWEFRPDFPVDLSEPRIQADDDPSQSRPIRRRRGRHEIWTFFSWPAGQGIVRVSGGAARRNVWHAVTSTGAWSKPTGQTGQVIGLRQVSKPVLMLRLEYIFRRWW